MNKTMISAALEIFAALGTVMAAFIAWGAAPALAIASGWAILFARAITKRPTKRP